MRKGSWLNRPVIVKQAVETNINDVLVARAEALPAAINAIAAYNGANGRMDYNHAIEKLTKSLTT